MNEQWIHVDGSKGEGGGQVLRASLALSMALRRPFRMTNIRARRPKPGLKRQHLASVLASQQLCGAQVTGASINAQDLSFYPGPVQPGDYHFDIGSGGSCTLVLQALLPALLAASGPSRIRVTGGTHVPHAPTFDFFQQTLLPWLERLGPRLTARLERPGFMHAGGGCICVEVQPAPLRPLGTPPLGRLCGIEGIIYLCNLEHNIAEREMAALRSEKWHPLGLNPAQLVIEQRPCDAEGAGNAVLLALQHESGTTICSAIGQRGLTSERVARQALQRALTFLHAQVPVDQHLADQLLVPLALAGGGTLLTEQPSLHCQTCLELLSQFMDLQWSSQQEPHNPRAWTITLQANAGAQNKKE